MTKIKEKLYLLNPRIKEEIKKREELCKKCEFNSVNAPLLGLAPQSDRLDLHCSICECTIGLFTRSLDSNCSIEKWNEKHKTNLELKWKSLI